MSDQLLEWSLSVSLGMIVTYVAFSYLSALQEDFAEERAAANIPPDSTSPVADLYLSISPQLFNRMRLGLTVFLGVLGAVASIMLGVLLALAAWFGPLIWIKRMRQKRVMKIETQLIDGLELLGNSLRSGMTLQQSVELLVQEFPPPISQEFSHVLSETRVGVDFTDALANMGERLQSNIVAILASGVAVTKRCGGDMTTIFQSIAQTIREQATIEGKLNAVTAQGRFQGFILGCMPFALVVVLWFVDRAHVNTLFGYTLGRWAFTLVIVMVILAQLWIRKLLDIDV